MNEIFNGFNMKPLKKNFYALFFVAVVMLLNGFSNSSYADFSVSIKDECGIPNCTDFRVKINGVITKSDFLDFSRTVKKSDGKGFALRVSLNSVGGDLEAAIAIGRLIRKFSGLVTTFDNGVCYSSCVFILAGGVSRSLSSTIGIHRPYSIGMEDRKYQDIQNNQRNLAKIAKEYLEEMNVLPSLYDAMVVIPPEKIKLLSQADLQNYGILKIDPVIQELMDTNEAREYGLSKTEFMRRKAKVDTICASELRYVERTGTGDFNAYNECEEKVFRSK
jgi:hypothetical protein